LGEKVPKMKRMKVSRGQIASNMKESSTPTLKGM